MKKFLGIDYGDKRVGLALAEDRGPALPFKVLQNSNQLFQDISNIIQQENIDEVVVGLPHSLSGQKNQRLSITKRFIDNLKSTLNIKVSSVDEQLTSKLYERMGIKKDIDKYAAAAILDTYLSQNDL